MKYIEFCAGIGGMTAGLNAAGWRCVMAVDNDPDAVAVHRLAHGHCELADVTKMESTDLPDADAWVAGFPCQPFSSSGHRSGFGHRSGNVFEHLVRLIEKKQPNLLLLENVEGLLTNKSGHTLSVILQHITRLGYEAAWLLINLQWFGVPQTRDRLFIVAGKSGYMNMDSLSVEQNLLDVSSTKNPFKKLITSREISFNERGIGILEQEVKRLAPAVGKAEIKGKNLFGRMGSCSQGRFTTFDIKAPAQRAILNNLGLIVAPNLKNNALIRSIRYWTTDGGKGPTKLYLRAEPISHCIGTSIGGAPLFAVRLDQLKKASDRKDFLEFANWHREQDGLLVMRLRPDRAVRLFGPHTDDLQNAVSTWDAGDTRKYKLVGNMVAPICAKTVAELINDQLSNHLE